jgi:Flp pilus assembly protein TadD
MPAPPDPSEQHFQKALDLYAEGHSEKAIDEYQRCLSLNPSHSEALHGLARAYQELSRFDESLSISRRMVELEPDDPLSFTSLSIALHKKGLIAEAETAANQARILGWKKQLRGQKQRSG